MMQGLPWPMGSLCFPIVLLRHVSFTCTVPAGHWYCYTGTVDLEVSIFLLALEPDIVGTWGGVHPKLVAWQLSLVTTV